MIRAAALTALAVVLGGCGFPGEPLPPALNRPTRVNDLAVVERGSNVVVHFTIPKLTTEGLPIPGNPDIEIRMGEMPPGGWSQAAWEKASERVPYSQIKVQGQSASAVIDASKFYGKTVVVGVEIHGPQGRSVGWSIDNLVLVPALPVPRGLAPKNAPDAVQLEWHAAAPQFRVFRKGPGDADFRQIGTVDKPMYLDGAIEFGKTYQYEVQSIEKSVDKYAESEISEAISFTPVDQFPPAVPSGVTAVPGAKSIELVWERNVERDLASYRVYRNGMKIAEGLISPSYSDKDVTPGTTYRYQVSALDNAGNESAQSPAVEARLP